MGMSVAIPGSVATTQTTAPGENPFMARAISTMGYGQRRPEVSRVRSGAGSGGVDIAAPFIAMRGRGQPERTLYGKASLPKERGGGTFRPPMVKSLSRPLLGVLAVALLAGPIVARPADPAPASRPVGLIVSADLGGGGQLGTGSAYDPPGIFELEVGVAYEVFLGLAPQVSMVLGMAPGASFAIRPGLVWYIPETPFYVRAAFDASTQVGYMAWRWLLLGGGAAIRVTDVLGFMVEGDSGVPLSSGAGVPLLIRAGAFARF